MFFLLILKMDAVKDNGCSGIVTIFQTYFLSRVKKLLFRENYIVFERKVYYFIK
jgi:hypothetical protein